MANVKQEELQGYKERIECRIDKELAHWYKDFAKEHDRTIAYIVEEALRTYKNMVIAAAQYKEAADKVNGRNNAI